MTARRLKAAVMVITYNHAKFIGQTLDSILSQKRNFDLVINVVDDCSTDGAQDVIRRYAAENPGVVIPYLNRKNIGRKVTQRNFYRGFKTFGKADYITIIEGDDYWTDDAKLQDQIDFLEASPEYAGCGHNVMKVYDDGVTPPHLFLEPPDKPFFDVHDLIMLRAYMHTTTLTYRNVYRGRPPRAFRHRLSCDLFVTASHAAHGPIKFDPAVRSAYRVHAGGQFSGMNPTQGWIFNIDGMRKYNGWLRYRFWRTYVEGIYLYCDYLLANGKAEEGLTPKLRRKYTRLAKVYKSIHDWGLKHPAKGTPRSWP
jgi:glycosyltransferase involved in cell wall biosynthesis